MTTGETEKIEPQVKNPHAQALSKLGASKGGQARAKTSAKKRSRIARKAAKSRWNKIGNPTCNLVPHAVPFARCAPFAR